MRNSSKLPMNADEMLAEARRLTGIDIADEAAREPLNVLVNSLNNEAGLSTEGAPAKHDYLMRFLCNRLRMQRDFAAHPEIADIQLKPPVIINAMARTGSTKMQKVLAATGDFNWLPMWVGMNPASWTGKPNEEITPRINDIKKWVSWFTTRSPQANAGHAMEPMEPDEDSTIMMHSLISQTMSGYANAPSYLEWYFGQDRSIQFRYTTDMLKYLVWQGLADPAKPFVLKSAMSIGNEEHLLAAHGKPFLITTHRNPHEFVGSSCKLVEVFRKPYSDQVFDLSGLVDSVSMIAGMHLNFRKRFPDVPIFDLDYRRLLDNAVEVVREIYELAGIQEGPETLSNVEKWEKDNPKNKHGSFKYSLEDYRIGPDDIDAAFAEFNELARSKGIDY